MALTAADLAMFARLGVPPELLEQAGIERVSDEGARQKFGINGSGDRAGIVFPYLDPITRMRYTARLRRDHPDIEDNKEVRKYVAAFGDSRHLYLVPGCAESVQDITVPVVLVEAEKSALALTAWSARTGQKMLPIAMGGCWGWRGRIGRKDNSKGERVDEVGPLPELRRICSKGRRVFVLLDSNVTTNPKVQQARAALAQQLRRQGAQVCPIDLPIGDWNGPDDFIAACGDQALADLFTAALEIDGATLLDDVRTFIRRFVVLSPAQATVLSLFVLYTHVAMQFECAPYVQITSAEKRSGKSRLLEVLAMLVHKPWLTSRTSAAALVRKLNEELCCLLLDESDAAFGGDKEYSEALRGVLNAGHRKGCKAYLCVGKGADIKVVPLDVFGPKVIAGIGRLPDTVADRAIPIQLQRKVPTETVERFRQRVVGPGATQIHSRLVLWANPERGKLLAAAWPELPNMLGDRQQDVSEPLLAVADAAGGDWPTAARSRLVELFSGKAADDESIGVRLLSDTREVFESGGHERLSSVDLVSALIEFEGSPWPEFNHGKQLTPTSLARLLRRYEISPRPVRAGSDVFKGYHRSAFEDAWNRYLPPCVALSDSPAVTELQPAETLGGTRFPIGYKDVPVTAQKSEESPVNTRLVTSVTAKNPLQATRPDSACDQGEAALVLARLAMGLSVSPELRKKYATGGVEL